MDDKTAFLEFNFAPPCVRRDIGILGLIHKRVLGLAHPAYNYLLPFLTGPVQARYHSKTLANRRESVTCHRNLFNRSIFGYVDVYNRLPEYVVECKSISDFQHELTVICKRRCRQRIQSWMHSFSMYRRDFDPSIFD